MSIVVNHNLKISLMENKIFSLQANDEIGDRIMKTSVFFLIKLFKKL